MIFSHFTFGQQKCNSHKYWDNNNNEVLLNRQWDTLTKHKYKEIQRTEKQCVYRAIRDSLCCYLNDQGDEILLGEYEYISDFNEGYACVLKNNKWGFIDTSFVIKVALELDNIFGENPMKACRQFGFPCKLPFGHCYSPSTEIYYRNYVKTEFRKKINYQFRGGAIHAYKEGKSYILTNKGQYFPIPFDSVTHFENEIAFVIENGKFGAIDKTGKQILPISYNLKDYSGFDYNLISKGRIIVKKNGKMGILNFFENDTIMTEFDRLGAAFDNSILAWKNNKIGLINLYGKELTPFLFERFRCLNDYFTKKRDRTYLISQIGSLSGIIDSMGNIYVPFEYDKIQANQLNFDYIELTKNNTLEKILFDFKKPIGHVSQLNGH